MLVMGGSIPVRSSGMGHLQIDPTMRIALELVHHLDYSLPVDDHSNRDTGLKFHALRSATSLLVGFKGRTLLNI